MGPDWPLVERASSGYCVAPRHASRDAQKILLGGQAEPDWLYKQGQRIADALNRGEIALAQIYGLRIPIGDIDRQQLKQLTVLATLQKAGFNPDEPRIPAGEPDAGEWTTDGDAGAAGVDDAATDASDSDGTGDIEVAPDASIDGAGVGRGSDGPGSSATSDTSSATPTATQLIDQQTHEARRDNNSNASSPPVVSAAFTVPPSGGGNDQQAYGGTAGWASIEAQLIQAGYRLTPEMWLVVRELYRLFMAHGGDISAFTSYLTDRGLQLDELPAVIKSLFDGPKPLSELQTDKGPAGFDIESQLRKYLGDPPPGYEWHHIIEQNGQFRPDLTSPEGVRTWIQNTTNVVMVPVIKHYCINGIMSRKPGGDLTVRGALKFHEPAFQRDVGLGFLKFCGVIQ